MKISSGFQSFLGTQLEAFVAYKRSLGRRYHVEEKALGLFDRYLLQRQVCTFEDITPAFIDEFLRSRQRPRPRSYNHLRCTIGRFFAYLVNQESLSKTPLQSPPRRARYERTPFIFDSVTAQRLLAITQTFSDSGGTVARGQIYYAIFAILYALGLRIGEVCRLRVKDVDLEQRLLVIRETKFYKTRLVPFGPKVEALLIEHIRRTCPELSSPERPLFCLRGDRAINPSTISQTFHHLIPRLQLSIPPGVSSPRLHDLRHSCAVATLTRWYREGLDPQARLHTLATFLGHVDINSTAVYLTTTPTLLELANQRFRTFAATTLKEGLTS